MVPRLAAATLAAVTGTASALELSASAACTAAGVQNGHFVDSCGRQRIWHGLNSVWKGFPWVVDTKTFQGGGRSLAVEDAAFWSSLGFNSVRLGVMWSGVQPTGPDSVNATYLTLLTDLIDRLYKQHGIFTLLDAHQDLLSNKFCGDGAPTWAADILTAGSLGFPLPLKLKPYATDPSTGYPAGNSCAGLPWGAYYMSDAVALGFGRLYKTPEGRQMFARFWASVLDAVSAAGVNTCVLAAELLNEPWSGNPYHDPLLLLPGVADRLTLQPFFQNVSAELRARPSGANVPLAWEPVTWDVFMPAGFTEMPENSVLSVHYYKLPDVLGSKSQMASRRKDAHRLKSALLLTEFDVDLPHPVNPPYKHTDLRATLDAADSAAAGWMGWEWGSLWDGSKLVVEALRELARPFPAAVAGVLSDYSFTLPSLDATAGGIFKLTYTHDCATLAPTDIFLSSFWFGPPGSNRAPVVEVRSVPAGAVQWQLQPVSGAQPSALVNATFGPGNPPPPLAFTRLLLSSTTLCGGAAASAAVTVTVSDPSTEEAELAFI